MSFKTLSRDILKRHDEEYILQKKVTYVEDISDNKLKDEVGNVIEKDEIGNIKDTWEDLQVLSGVIQHRQYEKQRNRVLSITEAGEESTVRYYGYFDPTFSLKTDALADYRVKFVRDYETLYLKILEYDPNNYLRDNHHHIVLGMERDRKYEGRQRGKKTPNITLDAPDSILEGEEAILTLTFPDDAVGDVIINDRYRMIIENGTISTPILDLLLGKNIVTVKFLGDTQYNDVILTHEILVKDNIKIVVPNNITKYYSGPERLPITILNVNDEPIGNMEVFIELNGVKYRRVTKTEDGSSSIPLNIQPGIYKAHITVGDKVTQCNITILNTISHDRNKIFNSSKRYFAIFFDGEGNFLPKNTTIQFEVNGVRYSRKVSTDDGIAFLGRNLPEGDYTITSFNTVI